MKERGKEEERGGRDERKRERKGEGREDGGKE